MHKVVHSYDQLARAMLFVGIWGPLLFSDDVDQIHFAAMYDARNSDLNIYCLRVKNNRSPSFLEPLSKHLPHLVGSTQDRVPFAYLKFINLGTSVTLRKPPRHFHIVLIKLWGGDGNLGCQQGRG